METFHYSRRRTSSAAWIVLAFLLLLIAIVTGYILLQRGNAVPPPPPVAEAVHLSSGEAPPARGFRFSDVPRWLFVHVAIIAACQVFALMAALVMSQKEALDARGEKAVQFLCEIPMYLGLFGTLLGVCLTQFITGSLVAPLAYLTTMSGIVLHVFGKLAIWLPVSHAGENEV